MAAALQASVSPDSSSSSGTNHHRDGPSGSQAGTPCRPAQEPPPADRYIAIAS
jgi:hypothetical protein